MKYLYFLFGLVLMLTLPAIALAQGEEVPPEVVDWMAYAMLALNSLMIPLGADLLKGYVKPIIPSWLMTLLPVVLGSLIALLESKLVEVLGFPVDLSLIEQALLGGGGGAAATVAYKFGKAA